MILKKRSSALLMKLCYNNIEELTSKMVIQAAEQNDDLASEVFLKSVKTLGASIAGARNALVSVKEPRFEDSEGGVAIIINP